MGRFPFPRSQCLGRAFCDVRNVQIVSHCFVYFVVLDVRGFMQALFRESHLVWDPFIRVRGPSNGLANQRGRDGCRGAVDARCGGAVRSAWGHAGVRGARSEFRFTFLCCALCTAQATNSDACSVMHQTAVSDACAVAVLKTLFRILQVCFREVNYASVWGMMEIKMLKKC